MLYFLAENLSARAAEFAARIDTGSGGTGGAAEVEASIERLFTWAAWADKHDGAVKPVPLRGLGTLALCGALASCGSGGGGEGGGRVVAEGTPEHVATVAESFTGQYLAPVLERQGEKLTRQAS